MAVTADRTCHGLEEAEDGNEMKWNERKDDDVDKEDTIRM